MEAVIRGWLPTMSANGSRQLHWSNLRKRHGVDRDTAWAAAKQAGWTKISGKARLTITLVFAQHRRRDADNLHFRCKGVVDGLKAFFVDDDIEHLDLHIGAEVVPGVKETRLTLEAAE